MLVRRISIRTSIFWRSIRQEFLQTGKYAYPFSLELSDNIPGSFSSRSYDAKIEYKLIAYFANFSQAKHRQVEKIPLLIRQPFRAQQNPVQGQVSTNPKSLICFSQGEVALEAWFQKNVCFQGDTIKVQGKVDNTRGESVIKNIKIQLVQYTFVSANNGVFRNYKKVQHSHLVYVRTQKGKQSEFEHSLKIPLIHHQTAISTLVANYFRLEVSTDAGLLSVDNPTIISPIFILKKSFDMKQKKPKNISLDNQAYRTEKTKCFKAPEYWFRKNRNLDVMNFRMEDIATNNHISQF